MKVFTIHRGWILATAALAVALTGGKAQAQVLLSEGFESVAGLAGSGWSFQNRSALASSFTWRQATSGSNTLGPAPSGPALSYAIANYLDTSSSSGATISNWMLTPTLSLTNGTTVSFFSRTSTGAPFADRLEVRLSTAGTSTNVGTTSTSVGDFTAVLLTINPTLLTGAANYPDTWTQFTATVTGLTGTVTGRVGFRYFVTNGGIGGTNSNVVGVDSLVVTAAPSAVVPEPGTVGLLGLGVVAMGGGCRLVRRCGKRG